MLRRRSLVKALCCRICRRKERDAVLEADLLGHLLKGDTVAEGELAEVQEGHAQALVLKVVDLLLT